MQEKKSKVWLIKKAKNLMSYNMNVFDELRYQLK